MVAAYERLTALTLLMIEQRITRGFLAHCNKVLKLVRDYTRADWSNRQLRLKLDMLRSKLWRERVLKDLGGERALVSWERRMAAYAAASQSEPIALPEKPVWRKTPERIAKELWQIAHAKTCAKATAHPRIFRDPFKVDNEAQFRMAPLPRPRLCGNERTRRSSEEVLATTPDYM